MTTAEATIAPGGAGLLRGLWRRQVPTYPDDVRRYLLLGVVVLATIVLYYELYVGGAVAPSILAQYDISFGYYVLILVFGNALGALASLAAGLADRWGRANLVAYGLLATGALTLWGLPNATGGFEYGVFYALVSIVEGMVLVATPALVRDYSPQVGRASAMGFWTLGPVIGSLVVSQVASHTFTEPDWQTQYRICGIVGMVVWAVAFVTLRELSPQLRDQLMVTKRDRALVQARARTLDTEAALAHHWAAVARPNVVAGALGVSVFLIVYYTAVAFAVIYMTAVFTAATPTQSDADSVLNWWWSVEAVALVVVGVASDRLLVRKPFMVAGGAGTVVMTLVLLALTGHPDTGRTTLIVVACVLAAFISLSYAPWMAAYTETIEGINPAATATGLAIWGLIIRTVVSLSFVVIPHVVGSVTPLVDHGLSVQADLRDPKVAAAVAIVQANPDVFADLAKYPPHQVPASVLGSALERLGGGPVAVNKLATVGKAQDDPVSGPRFADVAAHGPEVQAAQQAAPGEWQHWLWVCVGGEVVFIPLSVMLAGRWSPRRARRDEEEYEREVDREMAELGLATS